jgi:hypothetical protein
MSYPTVTCEDVVMPRPATGETPKRNIRVPDDVWNAAKARALTEGRTIAKVVNGQLARYGAQVPEGAETLDPWEVVNLVMRELADGKVGPETDLSAAVEAASDMLRALGIDPARGESRDIQQ